MWPYVAVFFAALAVDLIPFVSPPAWTLMVFLLMRYDLNPWIVLMLGVPGSTLGRYILSLYIPKFSDEVIKKRKSDELRYLGKKLGQKMWRSWLFVFIYSCLPLSTTALFMAAGVAKISPLLVIPPFFVGKFISDAIMVFTGHYAATNLSDIIHGTFSLKGMITAAAGLLVLCALLFIDWHTLLLKKKIKFDFKVWK